MKNKFFYITILSLVLISSCTKSCQKSGTEQEGQAEDKAGDRALENAGQQVEPAAEPSVFFETPTNAQELSSPIEIVMGVKGMSVRPAGEDANDKTSGHHHILVDHPAGFIEEGQVIPADERHIHFGQGQTNTSLELSPGIHTLTLQFADGAHRSYGKKMATQISVTVISGGGTL